jgi:glutamine amidotransferase-like uncharacterized protein
MKKLFRIFKARSWFVVLLCFGGFLSGCQEETHLGLLTGSAAPDPALPPSAVRKPFGMDVLLFAGTGTWSSEVSSLESLLRENGASYRKVSSAELNSLSLDELTDYGLLLFPGGLGGTQTASLSSGTRARLRDAVQKEGMSYLGFCAGAFMAVAPAPLPGRDVSYGLGVAVGPVLDYYYLENRGVTAAMTLETFADGRQRDLLWYGGPVTPETPGGVVARYPTGDPAITQLRSGEGFVLISAVHPAAPTSAKSSLGVTDSDGFDGELTWELIDSALRARALPAYGR